MKYVFVSPDAESICLQYRDFEYINGCNLIKIKDSIRHYAKALNLIGLSQHHNFYWLVTPLLHKAFQKLQNVQNGERICFILYSRIYESFRGEICSFLRKKYKNCIIVVYFGDLISRHVCPIQEVKNDVDLVLAFDEEDANKNNVGWLLEPFSASIREIDFLSPEINDIKWDVTFVGHAKNRYEKIITLYEKLTNAGLTCDFHIVGVPLNSRMYTSSISYAPLSFRDLLKHVVSSRCVAEIMQDNGISPTTRYTEAMIFSKNLLTDCQAFKDNRPSNVIFFESVQNIDKQQLEEVKKEQQYDRQRYFRAFSIEQMLEDINRYLVDKEIL